MASELHGNERYIFYDNSNIFIEAKKCFAKKTELRCEEDPRLRIDLGYLHNILVEGKQVWAGLYGSEPPPLDTVWAAIRKSLIVVNTHNRDKKNRERKVDTHMALDIGMKAATALQMEQRPSFVVVAGDREYIPCVNKLIQLAFPTRIVAWRSSLCREYDQLANKHHSLVEISLLDDVLSLNEGLFLERKWRIPTHCRPGDIGIPPQLSMIAPEFPFSDNSVSNRERLENTVDKIVEVFRLPFVYHVHGCANPQGTVGVGCVAETSTCSHKHYAATVQFAMLPGMLRVDRNPRSNETELAYANRRHEREAADFREKFNDRKDQLQRVADSCGITRFVDAVAFYNQPDADQSYIEGLAVDEFESIDENDTSTGANWVRQQFEVVVRKRSQMPTVPCRWDFRCKLGGQCGYKHTADEMRFFKGNPSGERGSLPFPPHPTGMRGYKTRLCDYFLQNKCNLKRDAAMCPYAHGLPDARCWNCQAQGRHWSDDCPNK